jgi:hypothetical protein
MPLKSLFSYSMPKRKKRKKHTEDGIVAEKTLMLLDVN